MTLHDLAQQDNVQVVPIRIDGNKQDPAVAHAGAGGKGTRR